MATRILCMFCAGIFILLTSISHASVFYSFQCSTSDCDGNEPFQGYYEFSESSVLAGRAFGAAGDILDFYFETPTDTYLLSGMIENIDLVEVEFSEDRSSVTTFIVFGGLSPLTFTSVIPFNRLVTNVSEVSQDFPGTGPVEGQWTLVPVPASIFLFGSGLVGLIGISRRRKAA